MHNRRTFMFGAVATGMARFIPPAASLALIPSLARANNPDNAEIRNPYPSDPTRPGSRLDALTPFINPTLDLYNNHTEERVRVRFFTGTGYDMAAVQQLNHIWRDWRQNVAPQIDPRLFWGLAAVRTSIMKDGHEGTITLLSGFRTMKTTQLLRSRSRAASLNSQHMNAAASDITIPGISTKTLAGFVEWLQIGGTGYYPVNNFTHADTGVPRQWRG